jgi:hypothetical protein
MHFMFPVRRHASGWLKLGYGYRESSDSTTQPALRLERDTHSPQLVPMRWGLSVSALKGLIPNAAPSMLADGWENSSL